MQNPRHNYDPKLQFIEARIDDSEAEIRHLNQQRKIERRAGRQNAEKDLRQQLKDEKDHRKELLAKYETIRQDYNANVEPFNNYQDRLKAFALIVSPIILANELAQGFRFASGNTLYNYVLPDAVGDLIINHLSSGLTPAVAPVIYQRFSKHKNPIETTVAITTTGFLGYEFIQAGLDVKEIDGGDVAAVLLGAGLAIGALSNKMPWNSKFKIGSPSARHQP